VYTAGVATALSGIGVLAPWESTKIIGSTTLIGIAYATINDLFACRQCIEYFTVGHIYDGRRLDHRPIMTLNPNWNALAWGMISSWHLSALAGVLLATLARAPMTASTPKLSARQIIPGLALGSALLLASITTMAWLLERPLEKALKEQRHKMDLWPNAPRDMRRKFTLVDCRNSLGYLCMTLLVSICAASVIGFRVRQSASSAAQ